MPCSADPSAWIFSKAGLERRALRLRSLHQGEIAPEVLQALVHAKQCGEMGRVDEQNISNALTIGRHPEQAVEFLIAGGGERVRTVEIDRLTREQMDRLAGLICDFVVWQMGMETERRYIVEQTQLVEIAERCNRRDVLGAFYDSRAETVGIVHWHTEPLHERAGVLSETLLVGCYERVPVMPVFDLALIEVISEAYIVMRRQKQAGTFSLEPLAKCSDFLRSSLLLG